MNLDHKLKSLSVVTPCHNEEECIAGSHKILSGILAPLVGKVISDYEIVLVDNGSTDSTLIKILELLHQDKKVKVIELSNNFGYQGSITAGMHHAEGDMIVSIDADLQDDPFKIEEMINQYYKGFDLVLGIRSDRSSDNFLKNVTSQMFYWMMKKINQQTVSHHGDFRLVSKRLNEKFKRVTENHRYIRGLFLILESNYATVEYARVKRRQGHSKFSPGRLFSLAFDAITSMSILPIRVVMFLGLFCFLCSVFIAMFILYIKLFSELNLEGWAFLALLVTAFGGLNMLSMGIVGEYVGRGYWETKQRPVFVVRNVHKHNP